MSSEPRAGRPNVLLTIATTLVAIAAIAGIYAAVVTLDRNGEAAGTGAGAEPARNDRPAGLVEGKDYRVLVAVARIKPRGPDGEEWDSGVKSARAPDPFYEIWWRDSLVYTSEEVDNVLVASWSNVALPTLYELLTEEKLSLEGIKKGALVTARSGDTLRIRISDDDPFQNDVIEEFEVALEQLKVGDQRREGRQGLDSMTLRVIPRDSKELKHLIQ